MVEKLTDAIKYYCNLLSINHIEEIYQKEAEEAAKANISYQQYLYNLLKAQAELRVENSINAKIKKAKFPYIKTLSDYDFSFQPKIDEKLIRELSTLHFLNKAFNIIFVGPPGVGKTHLAIALGIEAAKKRKRVLFTSALDLVNQLSAQNYSNTLRSYLDALSRLDLLIIDELGYLELDKHKANLFFKLISKRYEKGSIIITTNKPFQEWGEIFTDEVIASAILDRLLHHCFPFFITGPSYRTKELFQKTYDSQTNKQINSNQKM